MKIINKTPVAHGLLIALGMFSMTFETQANSIAQAWQNGQAKIDLRLRYEDVEQDNRLQDASALTLRSRLGYYTGSVNGFSAVVEMEDNRIVMGQGDYSVGPSGYNPGIYSVIADPEHTELDQGFIQYKQGGVTAKLGRQVITMDNHRFVGHVGWRQDRQTFDGLTVGFAPNKDVLLSYAYIDQRNRIFAQDADIDAKDHLLNASYTTSYGKLTAYGYLLEVDNGLNNSLDTFGVRFSGSTKAGKNEVLYTAEFATQSSEAATLDYDAEYVFLEAGMVFGGITAKVGYEVLGSDQGLFGFSTPLATLHKFNGWADQFLATPKEGLVDTSITFAGKVAGGKLSVTYHDFEADEATDSVDDLGSELDVLYTKKFAKHYSAGVKYAAYSGKSGRVDADKIWLWFGAQF